MLSRKQEHRRKGLLDVWRQQKTDKRRIQARMQAQYDDEKTSLVPTHHIETQGPEKPSRAAPYGGEVEDKATQLTSLRKPDVLCISKPPGKTKDALKQVHGVPRMSTQVKTEDVAVDLDACLSAPSPASDAYTPNIAVAEGGTPNPARTDPSTRTSAVARVQRACALLQRSGGCVVCFARGLDDWRAHALAGCRRGVATGADHVWRAWRVECLRVPAGTCPACCIPQNVPGGWHSFYTASFCVNRCPTPDIVKPVAYALLYDANLCRTFSQAPLSESFFRSYDDYASWLVKRRHPGSMLNILEAFLWLVDYRSSQDGFSLGLDVPSSLSCPRP